MNSSKYRGGGGASTEVAGTWTTHCTVIAADTSSFCYRACSFCERTLPDKPSAALCSFCCRRRRSDPSIPASKHLYRLLISIATADEVLVAVCFDRAARGLIGCSADEMLALCSAHPSAAERMGEMLKGEMLLATLRRPGGRAQHIRVASFAPMRDGFRPLIDDLRAACSGGGGAQPSDPRGLAFPVYHFK